MQPPKNTFLFALLFSALLLFKGVQCAIFAVDNFDDPNRFFKLHQNLLGQETFDDNTAKNLSLVPHKNEPGNLFLRIEAVSEATYFYSNLPIGFDQTALEFNSVEFDLRVNKLCLVCPMYQNAFWVGITYCLPSNCSVRPSSGVNNGFQISNVYNFNLSDTESFQRIRIPIVRDPNLGGICSIIFSNFLPGIYDVDNLALSSESGFLASIFAAQSQPLLVDDFNSVLSYTLHENLLGGYSDDDGTAASVALNLNSLTIASNHHLQTYYFFRFQPYNPWKDYCLKQTFGSAQFDLTVLGTSMGFDPNLAQLVIQITNANCSMRNTQREFSAPLASFIGSATPVFNSSYLVRVNFSDLGMTLEDVARLYALVIKLPTASNSVINLDNLILIP